MKRVFAILALTAMAAFALGHSGEGHPHHGANHDMMVISCELAFIREMIPHHQEAVDSAHQLLAYSKRPEMRAFAQDMIRLQAGEIGLMQAWLEVWYGGESHEASYLPMMRDTQGLTPDEADRAFLEDMIAHHQMALEMAEAFLDGDFEKRPEVVQLAEEIMSTQADEIEMMKAWLRDWYGLELAEHDMEHRH